MPGEGTGKTILTQTILFLVLSQRLKRLNPDPQWRVGNWGTIAMRTDKIPALENSESAMTEAEFNRLLDAVRMAIEPALREEFLTQRRTFDKRAKAADDQLAWPLIPFPEGWHGASSGCTQSKGVISCVSVNGEFAWTDQSNTAKMQRTR